MVRVVVVGAGIVGLATAHRLTLEYPDAQVTVLDKEQRVAAHQTGHNSGVIHAGVYYKPGSLKARLCAAGSQSMVDFCRTHGVPVEVCGKLIVATDESELPRLRALHERATANGLPVRLLSPAEAAEFEPEVNCVAALHVASTGIVDFAAVCATLAALVEKAGGEIRFGARVTGIARRSGQQVVRTTSGDILADALVNCAGLHADRVARLAGVDPPARIVPFRGEYFELRPDRRDLVRGLIYPVPDPQFPFLGVHLTRMIDGSVHAGPNAVLALAREGYSWGRINPRDIADFGAYPGLWRLARRHFGYGLQEVRRSLSRGRFARSLARLVPAVTEADLVPAGAGVRAQAITPHGALVDDFLIVSQDRQVHVLNAPSPAATSSLEIAKHIVTRLAC
ncbi:L-2-hydroxyglutarate oxidase [Actinomycetes bacterium KLBMP 9797]